MLILELRTKDDTRNLYTIKKRFIIDNRTMRKIEEKINSFVDKCRRLVATETLRTLDSRLDEILDEDEGWPRWLTSQNQLNNDNSSSQNKEDEREIIKQI